jgi:cell division transport system permease protein
VEINVLIKDGTQHADILTLETQIKSLPNIGQVSFVSKDQGLQDLKNKLKDNADLLTGLEQQNPLPDKFVVKAENPLETAQLAAKIKNFPMVDTVNFGETTVNKLFTMTKIIRNTGAVFVIGLSLTALFLISNTIKITIFARRREIEIMKLVGATNGFIRWPFLVEGLLIGVFGSILPILVLAIGYDYMVNNIHGMLLFQFAPFDPLMYGVTGILIGIGALIGMFGSVMSIRRFLRV